VNKFRTLCGLVGIWAKKSEGRNAFGFIHAATEALKHRGPDYLGIKSYTNCALGHTRLAIIDCEPRSNQPFESADGRYCLVFNGEIYNYKSLRNDLEKDGVKFTTN
jgi:asparagine synthase (glutamine-hydrolysing)